MGPWGCLGLGCCRGLCLSAVLLQLGSVLTVMAHDVVTKVMGILEVWATTLAILVSKGGATSGAMLICMACAATRGHDEIWAQAATRVCLGLWPYKQSGLVLMSMASLTTEG